MKTNQMDKTMEVIATFNRYYKKLIDNSMAGDERLERYAMTNFDIAVMVDDDFARAAERFSIARGDYIQSDREAAAFYLTYYQKR